MSAHNESYSVCFHSPKCRYNFQRSGSVGIAGHWAFCAVCPYGVFSSGVRSDGERRPENTSGGMCACAMTCMYVRTSVHQSCILRTARHTESIFHLPCVWYRFCAGCQSDFVVEALNRGVATGCLTARNRDCALGSGTSDPGLPEWDQRPRENGAASIDTDAPLSLGQFAIMANSYEGRAAEIRAGGKLLCAMIQWSVCMLVSMIA